MFFKTGSGKLIRGSFQVLCLAGINAIFLTACTPQSIQAITSSPTNVHIEILSSATGTSIPTTTPRPTLTIIPTSTVDAITALTSEFNIPAVCLFNYRVSNDQNWIAADCPIQRELIIANNSSGKKIVIAYREMEDEVPTYFLTRPLSWSSDNQYIYFTTRCCDYLDTTNDNGSLYQFDIKKELLSIVTYANEEPFYFFSKDGERYIYFNHYNYSTEIEIGMVEILTKESKKVVLKGYMVDNPEEYAWSKSNNKFAIVLWELQFRNGTPGNVLLRIDFNKWEIEILEEFNRNNLLDE